MRNQRHQPTSQAVTLPRNALRDIWFWIILFVGLVGVSFTAAPMSSFAQGGTVTIPPPLEELTVLVGPVDSIADDGATLTVAGVLVTRTDTTQVDERVGPLEAGAWVSAQGRGDGGGGLTAERIKVLPPLPYVKVIGLLDTLTDTQLTIDGITINRTVTTLVVGDLVAGTDRVQVFSAIESTGDLLALLVSKVDTGDDNGGDETLDPTKTHLIGIVSTLPQDGFVGDWRVSGLPVQVTEQSEITQDLGPLLPGAWVAITGKANAEGVLVAEQVQVIPTQLFHKLIGPLTSLNDTQVVVDGIAIDLDQEVKIEGNPTPGTRVMVKALLREDGLLAAVLIEPTDTTPDQPGEPGLVVNFVGRVDALPEMGLIGDWTIAGRTVHVVANTVIEQHKGQVRVGAYVKVEALLGDAGSLTALEIHVKKGHGHHDGFMTEFRGTVEALPEGGSLIGEWTVDGIKVLVSEMTQIKSHGQPIQVGDQVEVEGWRQSDGSVKAKEIELRGALVEPVHFVGAIEALPTDTLIGDWMIDGRTVAVTETTQLSTHFGDFAVGKRVMVFGFQRADGSILARFIKTLYTPQQQFIGVIATLPDGLIGTWDVGEWSVEVTSTTQLKEKAGPFEVGVRVRIWGEERDDGSILASKIESLPLPRIVYVGEIVDFPAERIGIWHIGQLAFEATADTQFKEYRGRHFAVGVWVKVYGRERTDGTFIADRIETRGRP
ncbi:MAG: DUF5666 domain-containing protein [Caldilineaceae bacterium]